jgi:peptidylprolyl isomerase
LMPEATFLGSGEPKVTASGIKYVDLAEGTGDALVSGQVAELEFTAWLGDGTMFDSAAQRPGTFCFEVGGQRSIAFFNEGLPGMKPGGKRRLLVLPAQGYGAEGRPPLIPPDSTLLFELELKSIRPAATKPDVAKLSMKTTPSGLKWSDVTVGSGPEVKKGDSVQIVYSGFLEDGTKFDSSADRCQPLDVQNAGQSSALPGLDEGLLGMKKGGRRVLVLPPSLAYGEAGRPPVIPMNATLVFDLELRDVQPPPPPPKPAEPMDFPDLTKLTLTTNPSGLKWADVRVGTGPEIVKGSNASMHYSGWLENGSKFDASVDRGVPFDVANVGNASVIAGWNEGLQGMKEGGRRVLVIPASLGYGDRGFPPVIPSNATLVFMIDAVKVK